MDTYQAVSKIAGVEMFGKREPGMVSG